MLFKWSANIWRIVGVVVTREIQIKITEGVTSHQPDDYYKKINEKIARVGGAVSRRDLFLIQC